MNGLSVVVLDVGNEGVLMKYFWVFVVYDWEGFFGDVVVVVMFVELIKVVGGWLFYVDQNMF